MAALDPPNAVQVVFHRKSRLLEAKLGPTSIKDITIIQPLNIRDENETGGPTPIDEYLIGTLDKNPRKNNIDWCNLYRKKKDGEGYLGYYEGDRTCLAIHPGKISEGCVVLSIADWPKLKPLLVQGSLQYNGSNYVGKLLVEDN
ncbi:hypothetical protein HDV00_008058 [Rhizophlyctis rosea]|nr:hypothetical protein HDV00_008058 [Rhizophlyctis rosea]